MFANLTGWHFLIILVVVLLIFGATRLPALARSLGQSTKILRDELKDGAKDDGKAGTSSGTTNNESASSATGTTSSTSSGGSSGSDSRGS